MISHKLSIVPDTYPKNKNDKYMTCNGVNPIEELGFTRRLWYQYDQGLPIGSQSDLT